MSMQQKLKTRGVLMLVSFFAILAVIFMPVFPGKINGLDYMDNLFNMISKGSSNFIGGMIKESDLYKGKSIEVKVKMANEDQAQQVTAQLAAAGVEASFNGVEVSILGDISMMTGASLADAEAMFNNQGQPVADKYGFSERLAMSNWWALFRKVGTALDQQEKFKESKLFAKVQKKALEPAYNYYGVSVMKWQDNIGLILVALGFYVVYTVWYGFGIMYLFEGLGLKISH